MNAVTGTIHLRRPPPANDPAAITRDVQAFRVKLEKGAGGKLEKRPKALAGKLGVLAEFRSQPGETAAALKAPFYGCVIPPGLVLLDLDTYKGMSRADVERALGVALPWGESLLQTTIRGGEHHVFTVPADSDLHQGANLLDVEGFDTRTAGKGWACCGSKYTLSEAIKEHFASAFDALAHADFPTLPPAALAKLAEGQHKGKHDADVIKEGGRNDALYRIACKLRGQGMDASEITERLRAINAERVQPPLPDTELDSMAQRVAEEYPAGDRTDADPDASDLDPRSGLGLALRFAREGEIEFAWTPGYGWMHYTGEKWEPDVEQARVTRASAICTSLATCDKDTGKRKGPMLEPKTWDNLLRAAESLEALRVASDAWDARTYVVHAGGQTLRLNHDKPGYEAWNMHAAACAPDFDHVPTRWLQFLDEITGKARLMRELEGTAEKAPGVADFERARLHKEIAEAEGVIEFLHRLAGYCLTGETREQKVFFLCGEGGNGKSVFAETLAAAFGDYAYQLPSRALTVQRYAVHQEVFAQMRGKRLVISSEIAKGVRWDEEALKLLTGGDTITAARKYQDSATFANTSKLLIDGNALPSLDGGDYAMRRRMVLVPFKEKLDGAGRDEKLKATLHHELAGILAWAIAGARKWYADGLAIPECIHGASTEYVDENDHLATWIREKKGEGTGEKNLVKCADLFADYCQWMLAQGEGPGTQTTFTRTLGRKLGVPPIRRNSGNFLEVPW